MGNIFIDTLTGNHIILRKVEVKDAQEIFNWRSGKSGLHMRQPKDYSVKSQEEWIKNRGNNEVNYIIFDKHNDEKVGTIGIYDVNEFDKVSNVGRLLLDEKFLTKSTPYGLEALLVTYDYVFNEMNFRKITGDILATNTQMFKLQIFLGMIQEGYLKQHVELNGKLEDLYIMSIFKEQFNTSFKNRINFLLKSFK